MFQKKHISLGLAVAALSVGSLFITGCGDDDDGGSTAPTAENAHAAIPLTLDNVWNFDLTTVENLNGGDESTLQVTETRVIEGEMYYGILDILDGSPSATYLRQSGHQIWVIPQEYIEGDSGDEITDWVQDISEGTFPWKYADTDIDVGSSWTILQDSGEIQYQGTTVTISIHTTGTNLGGHEVTVPHGTYSVARTQIQQQITGSVLGQTLNISSTQTFDIADGVGIVKIVESTQNDLDDYSETETSVLTSYTLR